MQQWASAAPAAAEQEKARRESVGVLKERSSKIPRAEGGLNALLTRYLDKTIGQYEKQKGVPEPMQKILSKMEWVVVHVLGRVKGRHPRRRRALCHHCRRGALRLQPSRWSR